MTLRMSIPLLAAICFGLAAIPDTGHAEICTRDSQCDDRHFCNGTERCQPGTRGADARGCVSDPNPVCRAGQLCNEELNRCVAETACPDKDGDGSTAMYCGGDDCDDNDPNRYPGNVEVWDNRNHDEDCDDASSGVAELTRQQAPQVCSGRDVVILSTPHRFARCPNGTVCIPQPNGSGTCGVAPTGYMEPAKVELPSSEQPGTVKPTLPKSLIEKPKLKTKDKN